MTPDEITSFGTLRVVIAVVVSTSTVFVIVILIVTCARCWKKKDEDEEEMLKGVVHLDPNRRQSRLDSVKDFAKKIIGMPVVEEDVVQGIDYQLGKLQISITHSEKHLELTLKIFKAADLPKKDFFQDSSDPYVKVSVLPDEKKQFKTKTVKTKLDPVWNESFQFQGWSKKTLKDKTIQLQVFDYDRFTKDERIGELFLALTSMDLSTNKAVWYYLQPFQDSNEPKLGELLVALCYQPTEERILVKIIKAKEVKAKDVTGASDPFVKVNLVVEGKRVEKRKTAHKKNASSPVYNEEFSFNIEADTLDKIIVECIMMDYDKYSSDDRIGRIKIGPKGLPAEKRHWNDMMFTPNKFVDCWHVLKE